jgi:type I restriction enzyme S subunit
MDTTITTELGVFPLDWRVDRFDSVFDVQQGRQVSKGNRVGDNQRPFLRTKNVFWNRLDLANLDEMHFSKTDESRLALKPDDLLICEGGDIGRTAIWGGVISGCYYQNHLHRARIRDPKTADAQFVLFWLWYAFEFGHLYFGRGNVTTIPNLSQSKLCELPLVIPPLAEQQKIAGVLRLVQRAMEQQEQLIALTTELKKALLHQLFTQGLRGEPQKQTEIGPVPESWEPTPLGKCCDIVSGSLSYTDFLKMASVDDGDAIECMGVKVSDMNLSGNENKFVTANAVRHISVATAHRKLVPPNTVVFPKRGAAIATNKKRLTTTWTVLDPNLIGVRAKDSLDVDFLFHWVQTFDLRRITDPGPTPQLNKKDLIPVLMPLPKEIDEQRDIANVISTIDRKLTLHQAKHVALTALFRTVLYQLMTAQIRVDQLDIEEFEVGSS